MPLVRIDAQTTAPVGLPGLGSALDALPAGGRVVVMIHGYKYAPGHPQRCPHRSLLAAGGSASAGRGRATSWPHHLGVGGDTLGIAFGWQGTGTLWSAWHEAGRAGAALARVLDTVRAAGRRADMVAHSLGARVALAALAQARAASVGRVILIAPAEFRAAAEAALEAPAGRSCEVLNVISRENDPFDALLEWLVAPHRPGARTLGQGLSRPHAAWTDLPIDDATALAALARLGHPVAPPSRRICHWSGYLRPGLFPLYSAILSGALPLPLLRASLPGAPPAPRWSRLLEPMALPLPFRRKAPM